MLGPRKPTERFECAAGNPPFIRYRFSGEVRNRTLELCRRHDTAFTALTSSWASFLVATATMLKPGGRTGLYRPGRDWPCSLRSTGPRVSGGTFRMGTGHCDPQQAVPDLSEDCWLLYCDGFGGRTDHFAFSILRTFAFCEAPPKPDFMIWVAPSGKSGAVRLRPFLLPSNVRDLYRGSRVPPDSIRLGTVARVGIGYVTGPHNDFFHLRPSEAERAGISGRYLHPSVRMVGA